MKSLNYVFMIPFIIVACLFLFISIYCFIYRNLLKTGKTIKVKIIKVVPSGPYFITYISYEENNEVKEKELKLTKQFKEEEYYDATLVHKGFINILELKGGSFYSSLGGEIILATFSLFILFIVSQEIFKFPIYYIIIALGVMIIIWIIAFKFFYKEK